MKKKILIIYPFYNHKQLIFHLVKELRKNGLDADAINFINYRYVSKPLVEKISKIKVIEFLYKLPIPKLDSILNRLVNRKKEFLKICKQYDIIDFHFLNSNYYQIINKLPNNKSIKITYWGSDFYRASLIKKEEQRALLNKSSSIHVATEQMKNDVLGYFNDFQEKTRVANFGIFQFENISKLKQANYNNEFRLNENYNKLLLVCGYNGSKAQQHKKIISSLNKLDKTLKDKLFLIFPMTYGGDETYCKEIESKLKEIGITYKILKKHLSNNTIAKLRIEADIAINIQTTDAFSGSLQEHLYSENVLVVGSWLPYKILKENQVFYIPSSLQNLQNNITDAIINIEDYKEKAVGNKEKMILISSWAEAGKRISTIYKEIQ